MKKKVLILLLACALLMSLCGIASAAPEENVLSLGSPSGIMEQADGSLLVSDQFNKVIWRIEKGKEAAIYAGKIGAKDIYGEPVGFHRDAANVMEASFTSPWALAPYLEGVAVTDSRLHVVRYINEKGVFTAVGSGKAGYQEGVGLKAQFDNPTGIAADGKGGLYVADTNNHVIRHVDDKGRVSTYAGGSEGRADGALQSARFCEPTGLCYAGGALYVADSGNHRICRIANGQVTTVAGMAAVKYEDSDLYAGGYADGIAAIARFSSPQGLAVDAKGVIYVADTDNGAIRKIQDGIVSTVLKPGSGGGDSTWPVSPRGLLLADNTLLVADNFAGILFKVDLSAIAIATIPPTFSDVTTADWFNDAVNFVVGHNLFQGTGDGMFSPAAGMSRAMYVTVLGRMEQGFYPVEIITGDSAFADVAAGTWYSDYVAWAADNGLVQGVGEGLFDPDAAISREQIVTILYRYAVFNGYDVSVGEDTNILSYEDAFDLAEWAIPAMQWAGGAGIIQGDEGYLYPQQTATRAQAAQILMKFYKSLAE